MPDSPVARGERIPRWARPSLVVRNGQSMRPQYAGRIEADDHVYLFAAPRNIRLLDRLFASPAPVEEDDKDFFGEFYIDTSQHAGRAGAGLRRRRRPAIRRRRSASIMLERLGGQAEVGDRVPIGFLELIVRDTDENGDSDRGRAGACAGAVRRHPPDGRCSAALVDFAAMFRTWLERARKRVRGRTP